MHTRTAHTTRHTRRTVRSPRSYPWRPSSNIACICGPAPLPRWLGRGPMPLLTGCSCPGVRNRTHGAGHALVFACPPDAPPRPRAVIANCEEMCPFLQNELSTLAPRAARRISAATSVRCHARSARPLCATGGRRRRPARGRAASATRAPLVAPCATAPSHTRRALGIMPMEAWRADGRLRLDRRRPAPADLQSMRADADAFDDARSIRASTGAGSKGVTVSLARLRRLATNLVSCLQPVGKERLRPL
jgi:hypothetical protein